MKGLDRLRDVTGGFSGRLFRKHPFLTFNKFASADHNCSLYQIESCPPKGPACGARKDIVASRLASQNGSYGITGDGRRLGIISTLRSFWEAIPGEDGVV
mmetsp:Transcript_13813/g.55525  ORF Transcript_13813/g.55525 Transcript_13813/m.55525 type:complete len:100 (+) Transcript_13813:1612-1911(+)